MGKRDKPSRKMKFETQFHVWFHYYTVAIYPAVICTRLMAVGAWSICLWNPLQWTLRGSGCGGLENLFRPQKAFCCSSYDYKISLASCPSPVLYKHTYIHVYIYLIKQPVGAQQKTNSCFSKQLGYCSCVTTFPMLILINYLMGCWWGLLKCSNSIRHYCLPLQPRHSLNYHGKDSVALSFPY